MPPVSLHPRLSPVVISSVLYGLLGAVLLRPMLAPSQPPFWPTAAALAGVLITYGWLTRIRRHGLRFDDGGVTSLRDKVRIPWDQIARVRLATEARKIAGGRVALLRFVEVASELPGARTIRFADLGGGTHRANSITADIEDVPDAAFALALIAARCRLDELLPSAQTEAPPPTPPADAAPIEARKAWGMVPFLLALGPKVGTFLAAGLKLVKPGTAVLTFGVYSALVSWQFALALMGMLFWHEYGHVRAMHRIGHPVRGIYFIPFLGGLAVHNAPIADRWHRVYVDLNGPAFGLYLTLLPFVVLLAVPDRWPWLAPLCMWWAIINLFNLLPILPLDGGRALSAVAFSMGSRIGAALVFGGLLGGAVLATAMNQELIALVTLVGAIEFLGELSGGRRRRIIGAMGTGPALDFSTWSRLLSATRPPYPGAATPERQAVERTSFEHMMATARGRMLSRGQVALSILAYVGLVAALAAVALIAGSRTHAASILDVLR